MSKDESTKSAALLEYGETVLVDELIVRSYYQSMQRAQGIAIGSETVGVPNTSDALKFSRLYKKALEEAEIKRNALFTRKSIQGYFGIASQIRNTGSITGKIIAFLLKNF